MEESEARATVSDAQFFYSLFKATPIGIAVEDLEGRPLFVNPALCSMLGFSEEELRTQHCVQFSPSEDSQKDWALFEQLRSGSIDHYQLEKRYFRRDGSLMWGRLSISLLSGSPSPLALAMVEDITDQRTAEEALRAGEERLRLAQSAARMGTFEWNIQTGENIWTSELEALYGLPAGSFGGTQAAFERLLHPDDRGRVVELVDESMKAEQPTKGEWRVIWPDGSVHWIAGRWQVFMNKSGEPSRMVGVNVDITERKVTENKLREYERAVEGSEEMMIVIDRQYRYLIANRPFLKRHRKTRDQVIGHFVHELANRGAFEAVFKPKLDECFQGKVVEYELKYSYFDLGDRDLSISYFPVEGPNGIDRAVCVVRDITDRKQAEQALAGMTRKLIEAEEQARTRIGRELHDDINQRLALLALQLEQWQDDPFESRTHLQELQKEVLEISNDVQTLSHELHSSKLEYLGVAGAIRSWCREFGERQKTEINVKGDILSVLPFEVGLCLFRVLQEALHNAVKHSQAQEIEVQLAEQSNEVHLIVRDSGSGFDVEAAMQGHGLGLTSMRERVRLVNGAINIESKRMGGTIIHIRVPSKQDLTQRTAG
jgi:PAS domain S-box-containing protein